MLDLDAIEARLKAATPGPWYLSRFGTVEAGPLIEYVNGSARNQVAMAAFAPEWMEPEEQKANAALIAHAPEDIAALLAECRRLRKAADEMRTFVAHVPDNHPMAHIRNLLNDL